MRAQVLCRRWQHRAPRFQASATTLAARHRAQLPTVPVAVRDQFALAEAGNSRPRQRDGQLRLPTARSLGVAQRAMPVALQHCHWAFRRFGSLAPSPAAAGGGDASSSSSAPAQPPLWLRLLVVLLKGCLFWVPAGFFWLSIVTSGSIPLLDLRTDEEIKEDEHEIERIERFFGMDGMVDGSDEYHDEWEAKNQALHQVHEKLVKSSRFMSLLERGLDEESSAGETTQGFRKPQSEKDRVEAAATSIEVSYILPPSFGSEEDDYAMVGHSSGAAGGTPSWHPRLILAHRSGALALVLLAFEHVARDREREERWVCTRLRAELLAGPDGDPIGEPFCDLSGHAPHGVRYMRI